MKKDRSRREGGEDRQIEAILERIREARNFDFRNYKRATLRRRVQRRMADRRCRSISDYAALLEREPAEFDSLISSMLIVQRTIIRTLTAGVVVLDPAGRIKMWNLAAERLLGLSEDEAVGQLLWSLNVPALSRSVLQRLRKSLAQNQPVRSDQVDYELPNGSAGRAALGAVPIVDNGSVLGSVIVFEDVSRMAGLAAEVAALKGNNNGKRTGRR